MNLNQTEVEKVILNSPIGKNTNFLKQSHSLWTRFKNYEKYPPFALKINDSIVSIIFATCSDKTKYINLYEIVTIQGHEKKGYATQIWSEFIKHWYDKGMKRIKLSCTPSSLTWHIKNGLVFWSVDKQGSLRSDQPLKSTIQEQNELREQAIINPSLVVPDEKTVKKLLSEELESLNLSNKKLTQTYYAIKQTGKYWLRNYLYGLQT